MFGYIAINAEALPKERQARFRAFYCGLCRTLRMRHGLTGAVTLSYDMTFLAMLLNALYEPGEQTGRERCATHPLKAHEYACFPGMEYAADMNVALAWHKLRDDWLDDGNALSRVEARLLRRGYERAAATHSEKCAAIERWLEIVHAEEAKGEGAGLDRLVNGTGELLGTLFAWRRDDVWNDELRAVGDGLGRFIYFMDAYEDLAADIRKGRFNPLKSLAERPEYEELCRNAMLGMMADATDAFERLPVVLDADILRNILYSGVWTRYGMIQKRRSKEHKGEE